ncbi:hypothetical protein KTC96_06435 [Clostridium estertheticum]|uniref:hypothetical protein n=1 Tax=Clostridium estertheticum TaxID=238834 RepID=UPI001C7D7156|nr:hypothetical protein [Clostridium estertheticum]MBX4262354.1 hypothetical protein [Clostridium estertheticum]WLC71636.1 hypothetical protein KTC96_06435 [Clostridium estertheticum]
MENYSDKKFSRNLLGKKIILISVIIVAVLLGISMLSDGEYSQATILGVIFVLCIYALKNIYGQTCNLKEYVEQKGYKFYRQSSSERISQYTGIQIMIGFLLVVISINHFSFLNVIKGILPIIYIQLIMKKRIKLHVPVDDAMYFELEEMGIINNGSIVKSLYKDFVAWKDLKEGKKVLLITQDSFICVNFNSRNKADKYVCQLTQINKLGILRTGDYMLGYLITIGCNDKFMKIKLDGDSFQDSPEEFISFFIKELDRCKLGSKDTDIRNKNSMNMSKMQSEVAQNTSIREIDFVMENDAFKTSNNNKEIKSTTRTIDL